MLYILGGRLQGHWNVVDTVFEYNLHSYYWSTDFASMLTSCTRCVSTTIRLKMFIAGDEGDPDTYTNVWPQMQAYGAARNTWTSYTDMATPAHGTAAMAYNDEITIPIGELETGHDTIFS